MVLRAAITVRRPADDLFDFWSDLSRLPEFMAHLESVEVRPTARRTGARTRPAARTSSGTPRSSRTARTSGSRGGRWRRRRARTPARCGSPRAGRPRHRGARRAATTTRRAGALGARSPGCSARSRGQQVSDDLRRFKQVMETGEVVRSDGSPEGTRAIDQARPRDGPAEPDRRR